MHLSRRQFTALGVAAVSCCAAASDAHADDAAAGVADAAGPDKAGRPATEVFDSGPLSNYGADGVYDGFRGDGFFLVRRDGEVIALSSVCTHKGCKVRAQADRSYLCKCHGSRFDPEGKVLKGPAKRELPRLKVALDERRHVLVRLPPSKPKAS